MTASHDLYDVGLSPISKSRSSVRTPRRSRRLGSPPTPSDLSLHYWYPERYQPGRKPGSTSTQGVRRPYSRWSLQNGSERLHRWPTAYDKWVTSLHMVSCPAIRCSHHGLTVYQM